MKKNNLVLLLLVLVLTLTGCYTTVSVNSLAPSIVDIGANQVIAVSPSSMDATVKTLRKIPIYVDVDVPVPNEIKGLVSTVDYSVADSVAKHLSKVIYSALSEGVYPVVSPEKTKALLRSASFRKSQAEVLLSNGVTLILNSSINHMSYDCYITGKAYKNSDGKLYYKYYLCQQSGLGFSYTLTDVATGKTVDYCMFEKVYPINTTQTLIGQLDSSGKFVYEKYWENEVISFYEKIINSYKTEIRNRLVPHVVRLNFSLLESSEHKEYKEINKLVEEGYLSIALDQYLSIYESTKDIVAAYNCAVLYYGLGQPQEAIEFATSIYKSTLNVDVGKLLQKMQNAYNAELVAKEQVGL